MPATLAVHVWDAHAPSASADALHSGHDHDHHHHGEAEDESSDSESDCELCDLLTAKSNLLLSDGDMLVSFDLTATAVLAGDVCVRGPPITEKQSRAPPVRA